MEKSSLLKLEKKTKSIEKQMIGELYLVTTMNEVLAFSQAYISNYIPILYYAVQNFDSDKIARLMNTSILIDKLLYIKINNVVNHQVITGVQEFIDNNKGIEQKIIIDLVNKMSSTTKASTTSWILQIFSLFRSSLFALYCNKKILLNYGIGWCNFLAKFIDSPHLAFLLDRKDIQKAEDQLDYIAKELPNTSGEIEKEINDILVAHHICEDSQCDNIEKYYVGLKLEWLEGMALIYYCKFLITTDKKYINQAILYTKKLLHSLENKEQHYNATSFRTKLNYPGPSVDIRSIVGDLQQYQDIRQIYNFAAYFKSNTKQFVLVFPTHLDFYFNYSDSISNGKGSVPILISEEIAVEMHERGCFLILDLLKSIRTPEKTEYYRQITSQLKMFEETRELGLSNNFILRQLERSQQKDIIVEVFNKKINKNKILSNVLGLTTITVFNYFAEAKGFSHLPEYTNITIPLLTEMIIYTFYKAGYEELLSKLDSEDNHDNLLDLDFDDDYSSLEKLEQQIEGLENSSQALVDCLNLEFLQDLLSTNTRIISLIKSSLSISEINTELQQMYDSLKDNIPD